MLVRDKTETNLQLHAYYMQLLTIHPLILLTTNFWKVDTPKWNAIACTPPLSLQKRRLKYMFHNNGQQW